MKKSGVANKILNILVALSTIGAFIIALFQFIEFPKFGSQDYDWVHPIFRIDKKDDNSVNQ